MDRTNSLGSELSTGSRGQDFSMSVVLSEAAGLDKLCDVYCVCTLKYAETVKDPATPRAMFAKTTQTCRTETIKKTDRPKWRKGKADFLIRDFSPGFYLELCLMSQKLLGSSLLGRGQVDLLEFFGQPYTDRWFPVRSKTNADAGSIRILTAIDTEVVRAFQARFKGTAAGTAAVDAWPGGPGSVPRDNLQPLSLSPAHRDGPPVGLSPSSGVSPADLGWMSIGTGRPRPDGPPDAPSGGGPSAEGPGHGADGPPSPANAGQGQGGAGGSGGGAAGTPRHGKGMQGMAVLQCGSSYVHRIPLARPDTAARAAAAAAPTGGDVAAGGDELLNYKVGDMIGKGSFGKVFTAMNLRNGELLAVKCIDLVNVSNDDMDEIQNEVQLLRTLRHRHVVSYIGMHRMADSFNILMEFCPGGSVCTLIKSFGAFEEAVLAHYTRQIVEGLAYIHSHAVMHRDIKGANVLVAANGILKIADFGASAQLRGTVTEQVDSCSLRGSPFWMAPEVIRQERYGRSADCWSMGMTVIEMATGTHPWSKATNKFSLMFEIAKTDHLPDIPDTLSPTARDFILRLACRAVEERMTAEQALQHPFLKAIVIPQ